MKQVIAYLLAMLFSLPQNQVVTQPVTISVSPTTQSLQGENTNCSLGNIPNFGGNLGPAQLPISCNNTDFISTPTPGVVRTVTNVSSFPAIEAATQCGDIIELSKGVSYQLLLSSGFSIGRTCDKDHWVQIRSSGWSTLPPPGKRVSPCYAGVASLPGRPPFNCPAVESMPHLITATALGSSNVAFTLRANTKFYRLGPGLDISRPLGTKWTNQLVNMGAGGVENIIIDRNWGHGNGVDETQRFTSLPHTKSISFTGNYLNDFFCISIKGACSDAQAINIGSNPNSLEDDGNYKFWNNFLEASGENLFAGGGAATITPHDIEATGNYLFKPMIWNPSDPSYDGGKLGSDGLRYPVIVKNLFELKNAIRVLFRGNILENCWAGFSQVGAAILLTPKNQNGLCPLCSVTNVTIAFNLIHTVAQVFQITNVQNDTGLLATAGNTYSLFQNIADNVLYAFCYKCTTGTSTITNTNFVATTLSFILRNVYEANNTIVYASPGMGLVVSVIGLSGAKQSTGLGQSGLTFINNLFLKGSQGTNNSFGGGDTNNCAFGMAAGTAMIQSCWTQVTWDRNCVIGNTPAIPWPGTSFFEASYNTAFVLYNNGLNGDYHLKGTSPCHGTGTDGKDIGANIDLVMAEVAGVLN